jgi:hypothetical protein
MKIFLLLIIVLTIQYGSKAQIIPDSQRIIWRPGIPGGIPDIEGPIINILHYNADPKGEKDSRAAIVNAINAVPSSGGVVYIPEGTYLISSAITISKSGVVIRGEGPDKTKLMMNGNGNSFNITFYDRGAWQTIGADVPKNCSGMKVPYASLFRVGQFAEIQQANDPARMYTNPTWIQDWGENAVGQMFEITEVVGDSIKFRTSAHLDYEKRLSVQIRPLRKVSGVGFEDFYIEKLVSDGNTFHFVHAAYCWIRNVESAYTRFRHVGLNQSLGCEVRDSYFHHSFNYGDGGSAYGVDCLSHSTDNLIENNIFDHLRHSMMVHLGACGNVFGYNYSTRAVQGDNPNALNQGWIPVDISVHGHYPFMNLFEGNELEQAGLADYWGPSGPGNTLFRNYLTRDGIYYQDNSHRQNIVGNITRKIENRGNTSQNVIEHGNVVNSVIQWNNTIPERVLPHSLYRTERPQFMPDSIWPPFGPDVAEPAKLPAKYRYESLTELAEVIINTINKTGCSSITWNDSTYTESGRHEWWYKSVAGLDSVVVLNLNIIQTQTPDSISIEKASNGNLLKWKGSTHGFFEVFRNGRSFHQTKISRFLDQAVKSGENYCYSVREVFSGCRSEFSPEVCSSLVSAHDISQPGTAVYPNPATRSFSVYGNGIKTVKVVSPSGQLVRNYQAEGESSLTVSSVGFSPGTYLVIVETIGHGVSNHKVSVVGS